MRPKEAGWGAFQLSAGVNYQFHTNLASWKGVLCGLRDGCKPEAITRYITLKNRYRLALTYVPTPVVTPLLAQVLAHVPTPLLPQVLAHLSPPSVVTVLYVTPRALGREGISQGAYFEVSHPQPGSLVGP